jgi:glucan phosphoethanolaminetransferase (alkaline phosphatase superfamily)
MNNNEPRIKLIENQMTTIILYILVLIIVLSVLYNDILKLKYQKPIYSDETARKLNIFDNVVIVILFAAFAYWTFENEELDRAKHRDIRDDKVLMFASDLVLIATIIVLYIVVKQGGSTSAMADVAV